MLGGSINQATVSSDLFSRPTSQHPESDFRTTSAAASSSTSSSSHNKSTSSALPSYTVSSNTSSHPPPQQPTQSESSYTATSASVIASPPPSSNNAPSTGQSVVDEIAPPSQHSNTVNQETRAMSSIPHDGNHPSSPSSPRLHNSSGSSPSRIKFRNLSHIQSFVSEQVLAQGSGQTVSQERLYEISSMPVTDIIEMVAGLLTKITATNDMYHEHIHRHIPPPDGAASLSPQASSVLAFHGKNVPSITILSYLNRILKYCPTTYEVFLSLLIYFDRMTEMVNRGYIDRLHRHWNQQTSSQNSQPASPMATPPPSSGGLAAQESKSGSSSSDSQEELESLSHFFVVDSYNIHRLVIAGVTCASKFFSDVFYTNSRYAKVSRCIITSFS